MQPSAPSGRARRPRLVPLALALLAGGEAGVFIALAVLVLVFFALNQGFLSASNIRAMLIAVSYVGIIGVGQTILLVAGEFDLSVGSVAGLCAVIAGWQMQAGFLNECKKLGAQCDIVGNPSATVYDVPASVALANAALAGKQYNCVAVYDPDPSINTFIKKLGQEKYPVVTWHVLPKQGTVPGLDAATGENIPQVGQAAAMAMGKKLGGHGTIALTQGSFNLTENAMAASFRATMAAHFPGIKVLQPQLENFEPSAAVAKAVSILQGNPSVTAAFSTTGNGAQTWSGAEQQTGRKLVIVGMDYIRQNLDLVNAGKVFGLAAQPLYPEGAKTADLCAGLAEGKKVPYYNYLPARIITKGELAPYYSYLKQAGE